MYILSRSSSPSCLVSSRLVSFLSIFFIPRPLARQYVFKIGLDKNPSVSVSDDVSYIIESSIVAIPRVSVSRGSNEAERKRRPLLLSSPRDRSDFSHPSFRAIRSGSANAIACTIFQYLFAPIVFSSPPLILSIFSLFTDRSDREIRYIQTTESPIEERGFQSDRSIA